MKKLLLGLGAATATIAPIAAVVACGDTEGKNIEYTIDVKGKTQTKANTMIASTVMSQIQLGENLGQAEPSKDAKFKNNYKFKITNDKKTAILEIKQGDLIHKTLTTDIQPKILAAITSVGITK